MIKNNILWSHCIYGLKFSITILISFFLLSGCEDSTKAIDELNQNQTIEYTISGEITGLIGSITLELEGQETITVSQNGIFNFSYLVPSGDNYSVVITTQPLDQSCMISNNTGVAISSNLNNIQIVCSNIYKTYIGTIYGDSQANGGVIPPQGWMGETLHLYTDVDLALDRNAIGGYDLQDIRAVVEAEFPKAGENFVIIEGGINDIVNTGGTLERMKSDISAIANTVLMNGFKLIIVNVPPWKGHLLHTAPLQSLTDNYNNWLEATYPEHVADIYSALEDPDYPDQLLPIYSASYPAITNLHISKSGMRKADEVIGQHFTFTDPAPFIIDSTNSFPHPENLNNWILFGLTSIGGDEIALADGIENTSQGLISTNINTRHGIAVTFSDTQSNINIDISYLARAGDKQWIRSSYNNKSGVENLSYIDVINLTTIHYSGATQTIEKYSPGWVRVNITTSSGNGGDETLSLISAQDDADDTFKGDNGTPDIYFDLIQIVENK